ncbi:MAG: hypothetical protein MSIBF_01775 [Candidatus Altiarchaeales archaeon IMC4]|nr:MAG: hypothetical protein MSIBF_01775 [Candidatus Altiarchaeales archaeon IMC4]
MDKKILVAIIAAVLAAGCMDSPKQEYKYNTTIGGVPVYSTVPFDSLPDMRQIAQFPQNDSVITWCNQELAEVSEAGNFEVRVTGGETGVYISAKGASIQGVTNEELLDSCHAFTCLRDGIECPDFDEIRFAINSQKDMSIVVDKSVTGHATQSVLNIQYVMGAAQKSNTIYSYIMDGDTCTMMSLLNSTGAYPSNKTRDCDIKNAFYIVKSDENKIEAVPGRITLYGDSEHLVTESVIVRDTLAPDIRDRLRELKL